MIPPRPPSGRPMSSIFPGGGREETDTRSTSGRDRVLPPLPVEEASESDIYMCELIYMYALKLISSHPIFSIIH